MRIALTHPWVSQRRGGDRFVRDLSRFMAHCGHSVDIVTTKPGKSQVSQEGGMRTISYRQWDPQRLHRYGVSWLTVSIPWIFYSLVRRGYDAVLTVSLADAYAARQAKRMRGVRHVFFVTHSAQFAWKPPILEYLFRKALERADLVAVPSNWAREVLLARYGCDPEVLAPGVSLDEFRLSLTRDLERPRILCTAALADERKGVGLLVRAFELVKRELPGAILQLSGQTNEATNTHLRSLASPRLRKDIHILGLGRTEDLPHLYGSAAVTVLPSMWEPFGLILVESLACGTPVVGASSGAIPEIVSKEVGVLFQPEHPYVLPENAKDLADAILAGIELSRDRATAGRCRVRAAQWDWSRTGPRFEAILEDVAGARN